MLEGYFIIYSPVEIVDMFSVLFCVRKLSYRRKVKYYVYMVTVH